MIAGAMRIDHLRKVFENGVVAIEDLSLGIGDGEFVAVLGPSGCGKSTLLRIIAGLERASHGAVEKGAGKIAYVFQDAHLLPWRNVVGNAALPLELMGVGKAERIGSAGGAGAGGAGGGAGEISESAFGGDEDAGFAGAGTGDAAGYFAFG